MSNDVEAVKQAIAPLRTIGVVDDLVAEAAIETLKKRGWRKVEEAGPIHAGGHDCRKTLCDTLYREEKTDE